MQEAAENGQIEENDVQNSDIHNIFLCAQGLASAFTRQLSNAASTGNSSECSEGNCARRTVRRPSLTSILPKDLLRGVSLNNVMAGFGRRLSTNEADGSGYDLSKPTKQLNDFISHDWQTTRWQKYLSLCIIYNSKAALACSLAVGVVVGVLQTDMLNIIPHRASLSVMGVDFRLRYWCAVLCPISFLWVLMSWHWFSSYLGEKLVFLDKLCIHQTDAERKRKGIYGLAAFLASSDRLVVLWSPRYFTRLWCAYELAAWCHLRGNSRYGIHIFPVATVGYMACLGLLNFALKASFGFMPETLLGVGTFSAVLILCLSIWVKFVRQSNRELAAMHAQLQRFSVKSTTCFCCETDHVHPVTGCKMVCDRDLIYCQLRDWRDPQLFDDVELAEVPSLDKHLHHFDRKIQTEMKSCLHSTAGLSYWQAACPCAPYLWIFCDSFFRVCETDGDAAFRLLLHDFGLFALVVPFIIRCAFLVVAKVDSARLCSWHPSGLSLLSDLVAALGVVVVVLASWGPHYMVSMCGSRPWQCAFTLVEMIIVALSYSAWPRRTAPETFSDTAQTSPDDYLSKENALERSIL
eukprot:TRINITY_DN15036_c0_g2_i1.p1 TRINITY_DN15036_c0_g2~~TRINITY_DN15036_c0_g2_i1.p1  ORF type:complete len:577 (+),score=51.50 TRINITY_DN15036_c0_g2_i1:57-1787(+)